MRLVGLAWRYLWARPLVAALNLGLLALGVAAMSFVVVVGEQIERSVQRDLAGIDLVVGAKGSPLQLILAGVFHLDVPTGNIPLATLKLLQDQPLVERVLPLSLGDSLRGYRIVGSTEQYPALYGARLAEGGPWAAPMQALLGADVFRDTGLAVGSSFVGSHGLGAAGEAHDKAPYTVVGRLERCGCVLDRLVLTGLASVWAVHAHGEARHEAEADAHGEDDEREVTLLLVSYRSPLAAATLPRWVNAQAGLQAAAPAVESARLLRMVGAGTEVLRGFGLVLLLAAGASVFVGLAHAVREREPDLAMLRMLGAPPWRVAALVVAEALLLALAGSVLGLLLGQGLTAALGWHLAREHSLAVTAAWASWQQAALVGGTLVLALLAASLPAWRALRLDVSRLMQAPS